jgi:hypothetical protein
MINAASIQLAIKREYETSSLVVVPNIFLWSPFESDLVRVTKSGYAIEYEIKLSRSDFKADFKKSKLKYEGFEDRQVQYSTKTKHELLVEGFGPTEFYYAFPRGLIDHDQVPEWAGIIEVYEWPSNLYQCGYRTIINCIRKAKRLNKKPLSDSKLKDIYVSCYYRYWSEISKRNTNQILML